MLKPFTTTLRVYSVQTGKLIATKKVNEVAPDSLDLQKFVFRLCNLSMDQVFDHVDSIGKMQLLSELAYCIATCDPDAQGTQDELNDVDEKIVITTTLGVFSLKDINHEGFLQHKKALLIEVDGGKNILADISLCRLQMKISDDILANPDRYFCMDNERVINHIRQRMVCMNVKTGLIDGIATLHDTSLSKAIFFEKNSKSLFDMLMQSLLHKKKKGATDITFDNQHLCLFASEVGNDVTLKVGGSCVVIKGESFLSLVRKLFDDIQHTNWAYGKKLIDYVGIFVKGWRGPVKAQFDKTDFPATAFSNFDKSQPYISMANRPSLVNLNIEVNFKHSHRKIVCRHLATRFIRDCLEEGSGRGKIDWSHYSNKKALQRHVAANMEKDYVVVSARAKRYDMIKNDSLGLFIKDRFSDMLSDENVPAIKTFLIESISHVMAIKLIIKKQIEKSVEKLKYVVVFYDPNKTNSTVRSEGTDLSFLDSHTLKHYVNGTVTRFNGHYQAYYPDKDQRISSVLECDLSSFKSDTPCINKCLTSMPVMSLSPTYMHFLIVGNFITDLKSLAGQLQEIGKSDPDRLFDLLLADMEGYSPGFCIAMHDGYAEMVSLFADLLKFIPDEAMRFKLLSRRNDAGMPGLNMALYYGHTDVVLAYKKLVRLISDDYQRKELIASVDHAFLPGICRALMNGHVNTIRAWGELVELVSDLSLRHELIRATDGDGDPGILYINYERCPEAFEVFQGFTDLIFHAEPLRINE